MGITILAVDNAADRLARTERLLRRAFPSGQVVAMCDPLAAGKYSFSCPVDVLLASMEMQPMDGWKLSSFVRHTNPKALVFLIADPELDVENALWKDEVDGLLTWPLTETTVRGALDSAQEA